MTEDELILTHILQCSRSDLYLNKPTLDISQQELFKRYKDRRQQGEPLQYILGTCNFMGIELKVDHRVLIPRPETEILVDHAVKQLLGFQKVDILDLGTGSGNIAIALAVLLPQASITSVDISQEAIDIAMENAKKHKVSHRITFVCADMANYLREKSTGFDGIYDLVISNPPYIPSSQIPLLPTDVRQEPVIALDAGEDGLRFYQEIIKSTAPLLRRGAYLMMEFGDGQENALRDLVLRQPEFATEVQILQDLAGKNRIMVVRHPLSTKDKPDIS